jgi:hypothetical protein
VRQVWENQVSGAIRNDGMPGLSSRVNKESMSINTGHKKPFSFKEQYAKGKAAEAKFLAKHPGLMPLSGKKGEYFIRLTMDKVELKTDFYKRSQTGNCFIELQMEYGGKRRRSGVFQAIEHGCQYFVYWFIEDDYEMWFNPLTLRDVAVGFWHSAPALRREIVNKSDRPPHEKYSAHGVIIPQRELERILVVPPI